MDDNMVQWWEHVMMYMDFIKLEKDETYYKMGILLLASAKFGTDHEVLADRLKPFYPAITEDFIRDWDDSIRRVRIWVDDKVYADWFNKDTGVAAYNFLRDIVTVVAGRHAMKKIHGKVRSDSKTG